jgi:hypothetical protein
VKSSLGRTITVFLVLTSLLPTLWAVTPLEQVQSLSYLPPLDLARLKQGEIVVERGSLGDFPRGVHLQSSYFVRAPLATVGNALLHWDPVKHQDPEVRLYREFALPGSVADFKTLHLQANSPNDKWLLDRTAEIRRDSSTRDLHLTNEEIALVHGKDGDTAWQEILHGRAAAFAHGGLAAVPPYWSSEKISPLSEFRGLLSLAPKTAKHFEPIINSRPLTAEGNPASEAVPYWEAYVVHGHTTLQLGLFAAQKADNSWQLIDCVYYPSDTYFMSIDLYQLWPVENGTLVWQASFVSALFRSYLGGADRFVAGKLQAAEAVRTIKEFRAEIEKHR